MNVSKIMMTTSKIKMKSYKNLCLVGHVLTFLLMGHLLHVLTFLLLWDVG